MAKLNNKQTELSSKQLNDIAKEIRDYDAYIDGINDKLKLSVAKYEKEYRRLLRERNFDIKNGSLKKTVANINKAQTTQGMSKLGFSELSVGYIKQYDDVVNKNLNMLNNIGLSVNIAKADINKILRVIKEADLTIFSNEAYQLDLLIQKRLINGVILEDNYQKLVSGLADDLLGGSEKLGMLSRYAGTYMNTALMSLSRSIDNQVYNKAGGDNPKAEYLMAGPIDRKTSQICMQYVGQTLSRSEWETIGADEGVDVFSMGLHWNCRHRWIYVDLLT